MVSESHQIQRFEPTAKTAITPFCTINYARLTLHRPPPETNPAQTQLSSPLHPLSSLLPAPLSLPPCTAARKIPRWHHRLSEVVSFMKEITAYTDPQEMVSAYGGKMESFITANGYMSLSRRSTLAYPQYRITRSSARKDDIDPWKNRDKLPLLSGGTVARKRLFRRAPRHPLPRCPRGRPGLRIPRPLQSRRRHPALRQRRGGEHGHPTSTTWLRRDEHRRSPGDGLGEQLIGRGVNAYRLLARSQEAYDSLDRELSAVAEIPAISPAIPPGDPHAQARRGYQTSRRARRDYYDFFPSKTANGESSSPTSPATAPRRRRP